MKHVLLASALILSLNVAHAKKATHKKTNRSAKMSKVEAKELCLTTKGAELSKKELKKCISKATRTGKV
jgi:hypothetical protein